MAQSARACRPARDRHIPCPGHSYLSIFSVAVNLSISSVAVIQLKETSCSMAGLLHGSIIPGGSSVAHIWWVAVGLLLSG